MTGESVADGDDPPGATTAADGNSDDDDDISGRSKRRTAIALASLAVLGAAIAIIMADASIKESTTAREATRRAVEAETATVLALGAENAVAQAESEIATLSLRPGIAPDPDVVVALGADIETEAIEEQLAEAEATLEGATETGDTLFLLHAVAERLSLEQANLVDQRITWNARASQYETVITVLGVAIFLIGFTLLVRKRSRPPLAIPGLILAVYCAGWTVHIFLKPTPEVPDQAIVSTSFGEAYLQVDDPTSAAESFDHAISLDDDYIPPLEGRAIAKLLLANPDLLTTLAMTNGDPAASEAAVDDLMRIAELSDEPRSLSLTIAGFAAITLERWDDAAKLFDAAIAASDDAPALAFAGSAVAVAIGDEEGAREQRATAIEGMGPLAATTHNQDLISEYLTLLSYVSHTVPEQSALADALAAETIVAESEVIGGELSGEVPPGASATISEFSFDDNHTTMKLDTNGIGPDDVLTIVGYELPAEGAAFVQPAPLFYVGPPSVTTSPVTVSTPRHCAPIEYRLDVFINGVAVSSLEHPGAPATC